MGSAWGRSVAPRINRLLTLARTSPLYCTPGRQRKGTVISVDDIVRRYYAQLDQGIQPESTSAEFAALVVEVARLQEQIAEVRTALEAPSGTAADVVRAVRTALTD